MAEKKEKYQTAKKRNSSTKAVSENDIQSYRVDGSEQNRAHLPYEMEDIYTAAIRRGDEQAAFTTLQGVLGPISANGSFADTSAYYEQSSNIMGIMSCNERKQIEYAAVAAITITTRAAIQGGVDPYRAYDTSDLYLQRLSDANHPEKYLHILVEVVQTFLAEVKKAQSRELRSAHVLHAKQYIGRQLNRELTLDKVAEAICLSPPYLSAIFKQTEGVGIKQYITLQRIEAAKNLLMYSDTEIGVIAPYVGFCSQSYFGKIFKDVTGMTPGQYRKTHHR